MSARGPGVDAARAVQMALRAACAHPGGGDAPIPAAALAHGIGACFERVVARHPWRPAVIGSGGALSYAELDAAANRMAHALLARTGAGAEPVALLFGSYVGFTIASLGALKAGKIQVPLDRDSPRARLAFMLEHSGARLLVTAPMVPTAFVVLAELPQTATGKIDRRALPPPSRVRPDLGAAPVAPRGPLEAMLGEIWADALELDAVGIHDGFLDLGGNSLRASQIVSAVLARLALPLDPSALFLARTIADMAATILLAGIDGPASGRLEHALPPEEAPGER